MGFLQNNSSHPTADDVYESLKNDIPTLSKTTVYNTLNLFIEHSAISYVGIDEKHSRFDGLVEPHAHFKCKKCGVIIDLPININNFLPEDFRGEVDETYFYIKGVCEKCKNE
jgi:Fur family peroxide stress response transcriptional regulator